MPVNPQLQHQTIKLSIPERVENVDGHRRGGGEAGGDEQKKTSNKQTTTKSVPTLCLSMLKIFCTGFQFEVYHSCCSEIYLMVLMQR